MSIMLSMRMLSIRMRMLSRRILMRMRMLKRMRMRLRLRIRSPTIGLPGPFSWSGNGLLGNLTAKALLNNVLSLVLGVV